MYYLTTSTFGIFLSLNEARISANYTITSSHIIQDRWSVPRSSRSAHIVHYTLLVYHVFVMCLNMRLWRQKHEQDFHVTVFSFVALQHEEAAARHC